MDIDSNPSSSGELIEQRSRVLEVGGVEAFGEPAVDRREQIASRGVAALVAAQSGKARGGAQFPELGLLLPGDAKGLSIQFSAASECPCRSSNWPRCRWSSAANQRSRVLSTICKASSTEVKASSICPAISCALARRAV